MILSWYFNLDEFTSKDSVLKAKLRQIDEPLVETSQTNVDDFKKSLVDLFESEVTIDQIKKIAWLVPSQRK